jgi:hypothetical protein
LVLELQPVTVYTLKHLQNTTSKAGISLRDSAPNVTALPRATVQSLHRAIAVGSAQIDCSSSLACVMAVTYDCSLFLFYVPRCPLLSRVWLRFVIRAVTPI